LILPDFSVLLMNVRAAAISKAPWQSPKDREIALTGVY
jgi:hypothetical protein